MITSLILGLIIGFVAAVPLGPINIYVVTQTLKRDFFHGLLGGLTAAVLDIVFCLAALVGIGQIMAVIQRYSSLLKLLAALLLTVIGIRLIIQARRFDESGWREKPARKTPRPVVAVVLLYVSNPALYGFWLGAAGMVTAHGWVASHGSNAWLFSLAVGAGSVLWYFLLVRYVAKHHHLISAKTFRKVLVVLAIVLFLFAGFGLASLVFPDLTGPI
ncbi:MAG TPA: LysE family transporter [Acidobacteriota bacterium]